MRNLFPGILLFFLLSHFALAQVSSSDFNIRIFAGTDDEAPTTPTLLSAVPTASTQIDLSWTASTDNYILAGYSVARDGVPVATTTQLTYADVGLVASTTYSYTVRAFDQFYNYSSSSNSLSTTTPKVIVPLPEATTTLPDSVKTEGTVTRVVIDELLIENGISTSSMSLTTRLPARFEVRWGRSDSYELGYIVANAFSKKHKILITDLEPGTVYEYQIIGYTPAGFQSVIRSGTFTTKDNPLSFSPVNVSHFQAVQSNVDVNLSWQLPLSDLISHVRIVRSHLGFPQHPQDGAIVYQGTKNNFKDLGILNKYSPVYYTAFVYDIFGNISSGAVAVVYAGPLLNGDGLLNDNNSLESVPIELRPPVIVEEATSTINIERITAKVKMPQLSDITISQTGNIFSLLDENILLINDQEFLISIPKDTVTVSLKSIIATVLDPTDNRKSYSFLLRINRDQTAYESLVPALGVLGRTQVKISIYDYEAFVVATYQASVNLIEPSLMEVVFPDKLYTGISQSFLLFILLITALLLLRVVSGLRAEDKK